MKLLLDTHVLLWAAGEPDRLSVDTRSMLNDPETELFFSAASLWEIVIKNSLGRADFKVNVRILRRALLDNGYNELSINSEHAVATDTLPSIYKDPFDRILIAQAMVEGIILLTSDSLVAQYPGPVRLA